MRSRAASLQDLLARETFFRDLPAIEQHTHAIESEYARRYDNALQARVDAYSAALRQLATTSGWGDLEEETQQSVKAPLEKGALRGPGPIPIPLLRSERDACESRLRAAIQEVHRAFEGERLVAVDLSSYFAGGIETEEQLDAALSGIREECARAIGAGKKVILS
jgi:hypothetical protein